MSAGAVLGGIGAIMGAGAQSGQSGSAGGSQSNSMGTSSSYGYSQGGGSASSQSSGMAEDWSNSSSWESGGGWSRIYGSEASAKDKQRAAEANLMAQRFWELQAEYNASEAQKARDFQEFMANTAYQRAIIDLERAGLNPILAVAQGGAAVPVGAMASSGLASAHKAQTFADQYSENWFSGGSNSSSYGYSKNSSSSSESYGNKSENWSNSREKSSSKSWNRSYEEHSNNIRDIIMGLQGSVNKAVDAMAKNQRSGSRSY